MNGRKERESERIENGRGKGRGFPQRKGALDRSQGAGSNRWEEGPYVCDSPAHKPVPRPRGMFWNTAGACRSLAARGGASP